MKKTMLVALLLSASSTFAADICTNKEGSIVYDSKTTFGKSVVIVNPRLNTAAGEVLIQAVDYSVDTLKYAGDAFCVAYGKKSGKVSEVQKLAKPDDPVAVFNSYGDLDSVGPLFGTTAIKTVVCQE